MTRYKHSPSTVDPDQVFGEQEGISGYRATTTYRSSCQSASSMYSTEFAVEDADRSYMKLTGLGPHTPSQFRPEWPTVEMRIECHNFKHAKESGFWICTLLSETHQKCKSGVLLFTSPAALSVDAALYGFGALRRTCNVYLKCSHYDLHHTLSGELVSHSASMPPEPLYWSSTHIGQIDGWNDLVSVARQHAVSCGRLHWAEYTNGLNDEACKLIQARDPDGWGCPF